MPFTRSRLSLKPFEMLDKNAVRRFGMYSFMYNIAPAQSSPEGCFGVVNTPTPPYHRAMIHRESFKATSISLPSDLMERLQELSAEVGEPVATVQRQVIRAAYKRGWTHEVLNGETTSGETSERCVVRLSLSPRLSDQTMQLRGAVPLSTWYRAALIKFLALHDAGDQTIWNMRG